MSLPPRVRSILGQVRAVVDERLVAAIAKVLDETEQQLFRNAEHARSNADQQSWFDALRELRRGRADVAPRLLVALEARLLRHPGSTRGDHAPRRAVSSAELDLVNPEELEVRLILEDGAARAEVRQNESLFGLGHRFAVLWGLPPLPSRQVPVGPALLNECFAAAIGDLRLNPAAMQTLLRVYERVVLQGIGDLLEAANAALVEAGVLRNLRGYESLRRETGAAPAEPAAESRSPGSIAEPASPSPEDATSSPPGSQPAPGGALADAMAEWTTDDQVRFDALRECLGRVRSTRLSREGSATEVPVGPEDLQTVLSHLQSMPNPAQIVGGRRVPQSVAHIRQAMLDQLAQTLPDGSRLVLCRDDEDVLDLMEVFLGTLQQDLRPDPATEQVLARLQVPLVRLALEDRTFFTRPQHPARQLLNAIADTSASWLEDDPEGRRMLERLGAIGDRISNEYQQGVSLFQEMFGDLTAHLQQSQRRVEAAERRHVEAARGRERLALARRTVDEALATRLASTAPDELLRTTLEQAWADVLALTLLRHGAESDPYRRRLTIVDQLLAARERGAIDGSAARTLRDEIEAGLALIGYHLVDIRRVMQRLLGEIDGAEDPAETASLAMKLRARARLGASRVGETPVSEPGHDASPEEQAWIERVRELPIGTWFAPGGGDGQRLKLAWRSEALGQVLLVNRRATSAEERGVVQLARELARGTWRVVAAAPAPPVERVFQRILSRSKPPADGVFHA